MIRATLCAWRATRGDMKGAVMSEDNGISDVEIRGLESEPPSRHPASIVTGGPGCARVIACTRDGVLSCFPSLRLGRAQGAERFFLAIARSVAVTSCQCAPRVAGEQAASVGRGVGRCSYVLFLCRARGAGSSNCGLRFRRRRCFGGRDEQAAREYSAGTCSGLSRRITRLRRASGT